MKNYKIVAPPDMYFEIAPIMNESILRTYALSIIEKNANTEVWREKVVTEPIINVVQWLRNIGYDIHEL